jgi:hypothetical protein
VRTIDRQDDLFGAVGMVPTERKTHEEAFAIFRDRNPWFMPRFIELARADKRRGRTRGSAKGYFEVLRVEAETDTGAQFRVDNNHHALAARMAMIQCPDLDGFFELRKRRAA